MPSEIFKITIGLGLQHQRGLVYDIIEFVLLNSDPFWIAAEQSSLKNIDCLKSFKKETHNYKTIISLGYFCMYTKPKYLAAFGNENPMIILYDIWDTQH